jgi:beta-carotene 15,15'-dioxygenase
VTSRLPSAARTQSLVFCVLAVCTTAASWWLPRLTPTAELALLVSLIVLVGVPHGALDPAYFSLSRQGSSRPGWLVFAARYVALAAAVLVVWLVWPLAALGAFLAMSAFHFSGDPVSGASRTLRALQGSAVIVLPALWHAAETETTLAYLAGDPAAGWSLSVMRSLALPLALALGVAALMDLRRGLVLVAVEAGATMMMAIAAPPLVSFTVYFCAMHSARHIVRTTDRAGMAWPQLALLASAPMLGAIGAGFVAWHFMEQAPANALAIRVVFIGLAALTVPHMAIVERARFGRLAA